jgi:cytochrome c oxidase cbb3-type subunit I/II
MWTAGITQGLMWRAFTPEGVLKYPDFIETVTKLIPFYWIRALGGGMYLVGLLLMVFNVMKTIAVAKASAGAALGPQVIVTPHIGGMTEEGRAKAFLCAAKNLKKFHLSYSLK